MRTLTLMISKSSLLFLLLLIHFAGKAQITVSGGTTAVTGSPYATLSAAITALNAGGSLTAPVVVSVPAGYTEALTGKITLTISGTSANTITIQKSGSGANPILTAYTGTNATPSTTADGFFVLAGSDYVTVDGIDLQEKAANTTTTTVMEFGYGLFKGSATDGCQNNTIKNCTITLNRIQNTAWTGSGHNGSVGIAVCNATYLASTALTITAASGSNSGNKFYTNTIQNCNAGIALVGFTATVGIGPNPTASTFFGDLNNDIGGSSLATGNTILNFGGGAATNPATGIFANNQWGLNVSFNSVNSNNGSGVNHATTLRGIFLNSSSASASATVNNNTVTVKSGATTSGLIGIDVEFGSTAAANTLNVTNNTVQNCTYTTATTGAFQGILTVSTASIINANSNTITNNSLAGSGQFDGVVVQSTPVTVQMNNNTITSNSKTSIGTFNGMNTTSSITSLTVSGNNVSNNTMTGGTGVTTLNSIRNSVAGFTVTGNTISSNGITGMSATGTAEVNGYVNLGNSTSENITNNTITGLTIAGTSTSVAHLIRGIVTLTSSSGSKNITGNTISNLDYSGTSGSATVSGIQSSGGATANFIRNKINDLNTQGASGVVNGINIVTGTTVNMNNNIIGHLKTPGSTNLNAIIGINASATATYNVYYNTIYLNATSTSATTFGTSCILFSSTATSFVCRNNVLVNVSVPAQEGINNALNGIVACLRRSAGTASIVPSNYATTSNTNAFWCNPSAGTNNHLTYVEGSASITNAFNTTALFKLFLVNRDQFSVEENVNFASLTGSNSNYLHINAALATQLESGAVNVSGITTDFDSHIRFGNTGYPGGSAGFPTGGSAPDIGADEFSGIFLDLSAPIISYSVLGSTCLFSNRTLSATITDLGGIPTTGTNIPRIYFRKNSGTWFSSAGTLSSGTATSSTWSFTIQAATMGGVTTNDVIQYYITAQDISSTPNVGASPSAGFSATSVNAIVTAPTTPSSYSVTPLPTFSAVTPTSVLCSGQSNGQLTVNSSAVSPVFTISPTATQSSSGVFTGMSAQVYTVTVTDASACTGTTTVLISQPAPLLASSSVSNNCGNGSASLNASQSGGTGPFTYQWISSYTPSSIVLTPSKDNTIFQGQPANSNALGTQLLAGQANASSERALLAFSFSSIPAGAVITGASLKLHCSGTPSSPTLQAFKLHKLLEDWGEGTSVAVGTTGIGNLVPATTGDATWTNRFHPSTAWTTAGGTFSSTITATTNVNLIGDYNWTSAGMVTDIQNWMSNSASNFGWVLKGNETGIHQARRFNSREETVTANRPALTVNYNLPNVISTSSSLGVTSAATYTLVVTDANGCTASTVVSFTPSTPMTVSATAGTILCNGGSTSVTANVTGASGTLSYMWLGDNVSSTVDIPASKDNTIYENNQNNSNGAGNLILSGNNGAGLKNRALLSFDLSPYIVPGSIINATSLHLFCTGSSGTAGAQNFSLFKMLQNWGEGTSNALAGVGNGVSATVNDATWLAAFYPSTLWTTAGGVFSSTSSGSNIVDAAGDYTWADPGMDADVQSWVDNPTQNFGWVLKGSESGPFQAKKFSSREEPNPLQQPVLTIDYSGPQLLGNSSTLTGITAGTYTVVVTSSNGCSASTVVTILQPNPITVQANSSPASPVCAGTSVTLNGSGASTYLWTGGVTNGIAFTPSATSNYTVTGTDANGCSATSTITIEVNNCNAGFDVRFFIQGYYLGNSLMQQVLYNSGMETNPASTNVDTVTVDLHDANSPYAVLYSYTGLLQTNGHIPCTFPAGALGSSYYIGVRHKNAVETWSATPQLITASGSYDFTTADTKAYGGNQMDVFNENIWSIFSGDMNQDYSIDGFDYILLDPDIYNGAAGYLVTDLNGDGSIDAFDYIVLDPNIFNGITIQSP